MNLRSLTILFFLFLVLPSTGQNLANYYVLPARVVNGDTILMSSIQEVYILRQKKFKNKREEARYRKLVRDLKKVYPYACLAREKLEELNRQYLSMKTEREKNSFARKVEEQLRADYEEDLKKLTVTQGRYLLKLIDRETGETSYYLIKELRGAFQAAFWQTVARIFGSNLKMNYDPQGTDREIEQIVVMIEKGYI
ncbi:MAG: DUF4294 domain-containing protein [Bacteroidales bacterium]